jgi:uncharacterized membrane protein YqhA
LPIALRSAAAIRTPAKPVMQPAQGTRLSWNALSKTCYTPAAGCWHPSTIDNDKLMWYLIIHMTFVLSALGMTPVERVNRH